MATGDFKVFDYTLDGLHLSVTATERADGQVDMVVTQIGAGYADINALYWNDGNAVDDNPLSGYSGFTGAKNESSLAMTGVGEVWDGGVKVSNTGLGTNPSVNKAGYLDHDGDTYSLVANVSLAQLETLGVRATSTSVVDPVTGLAGGSIKAVDDGELHEHSYKAVHTWDFESDNVDSGNGYVDNGLTLFTQTVPIDWTGSTVEIQGGASGYGGHTNYGVDEDQYLDTAASPGNISLTTSPGVDIATGNKAAITISVAAQDLTYPGNGQDYATTPEASFDLVFNSQTVHTFTLAEMNGTEFKEFTFDKTDAEHGNADLIGVDGLDTISIVSHDQGADFTGYSVDHIVLKEWIV